MLRDCHEMVFKGFSDACMGNDWASGFGLGTTRHVEDMDWVAFCFWGLRRLILFSHLSSCWSNRGFTRNANEWFWVGNAFCTLYRFGSVSR